MFDEGEPPPPLASSLARLRLRADDSNGNLGSGKPKLVASTLINSQLDVGNTLTRTDGEEQYGSEVSDNYYNLEHEYDANSAYKTGGPSASRPKMFPSGGPGEQGSSATTPHYSNPQVHHQHQHQHQPAGGERQALGSNCNCNLILYPL